MWRRNMVGLFQMLPGMITAVIGWLVRDLWRAVAVVLALCTFWLWHERDNARELAELRKVQAAEWHGKFVAQKAEMLKFVALVRTARTEAARLDWENIQRVEEHWRAITLEASNDYQADLAAARAVVDQRMRDSTGARATNGASGGSATAMSGFPALSTGPVRAGNAAIVDRADIDACTVNSLRLARLIMAWERLAAVDVNGAINGPSEAF